MPDYKTTREALEAALVRRGLTGWINKLPAEFVMATQDAVQELVDKELKDNK